MFRILARFFWLWLMTIALGSCFGGGIDRRGSVLSYRDGFVQTEGGGFRVGALPKDWIQKDFRYRALLFTHASLPLSLGVDAFCKGSFDDAPLRILTNQLFYGFTESQRLNQRTIVLEGREALRTLIKGKLDGAPVYLDVVVLKMNECVFDFFYIAKPDDYDRGLTHFEGFYQGFEYLKGPRID